MRICELLFKLYIFFIFLGICSSSLSEIPDDLITTLQIAEFKNITISGESQIYTNQNFPSHKFFKIDFLSIKDLSENKHFSFVRISASVQPETTYKSLYLYVNKTLYNFKETPNLYTDYSVQDKTATIFLPKKYFEQNKYLYFFIQGENITKFTYTVDVFTEDILIRGRENKFNVYMKPGKVELFYELKDDFPKGYFLISLLTSGVIEDGKEISLSAICPNKGEKSLGKYYPYFINGVGVLINYNELINCKEDNRVLLKIVLNNNSQKQLNAEFNSVYINIKDNEEFEQQEIYENTLYTSLLLGKGDVNKKCIKFKQILEDREIFYNYIFQIRSTTSDLILTFKSEKDEKFKTKNIYFTGTINMNINSNEYLLICMENNRPYNIGIQFQIMGRSSEKINSLSKIPLMTLINGFPTYFKLNPLEKMIYKIDTRQFLSSSPNTKKIVRFHLIKLNDVEMSLDHAIYKKILYDDKTNPIISNSVYEINRNMYLNYIFIKENSLIYNEYVYVECKDETLPCRFMLDVNLLDDIDSYPTQLILSKNYTQDYYYKPVSKSYIDKFKISLSNTLPENSHLVIILYMFSGDADLSLYDYNNAESNIDLQRVIQDTDYYSIGQKKYLIYKIKPLNKNMKYNLREIILKINCLSGGFYSLRYYTTDNNDKNTYLSLPIGELNFDKITIEEGTKSYVLSSLFALSKNIYANLDEENEYYISINSINCILEVEFMGKKTINRDIKIFFYHKNIKKNNVNIKIHEMDSKTKSNKAMCVYYLSANSVEFQRNLITINEGVVHTMTLDEKIDTVAYNYPYAYDDKFVSISLYKFYKGDLDIRVSINDKFTTNMIKMKNIFYKKIVLYVNELKKYCSADEIGVHENYKDFINLCPINIYIRLPLKTDNKNNNVRKNKFNIEISSGGKTPSYIHNGEMRFDSVTCGQYTTNSKQKMQYLYYYTDIGKNEFPSEIILNNNLGSSEMIAKIVKKDSVEMFANWDRRVRLPIIEDIDKSNYLKYNYELNKIIISEKDVENCKDGCEIYFGVFTRETSIYYQLNDFLIIFNKNYKNEPSNLVFNQNIDDSITPYSTKKYYMSHLENEMINQLVFTFNSDFCTLCIIMLKKEDIFDPNRMTKCSWKSDNLINGYKNYMLSIKSTDRKLIGKDLTSVKFVSRISSLLINNKDNLFYSLKVSLQNTNLPLIINVDSTNNEIARLDGETGLAYYAIRVFEYQIISEIDLCIISDEKIINENIVLYATIINQEDFNNDGFNSSLFNNDYQEYEFKSTEYPKNYLHIKFPKDDKSKDKIIFLVVKCNSMYKLDPYLNHYVKIMVAFYKPNSNTSLRTNNYRLYNLHLENQKLFIPLIKNKYSIVVIYCLKGKGKISIEDERNELKNEISVDSSNNKEYKIVLDLRDNYDTENKFASIKIKNTDENVNDKPFLFYINFYYKNSKNNLEVINPNKNNAIFYPIFNNLPKLYSLAYYFNLNEIKVNNDLLVEISFNNQYINSNENLNVLGALINDKFIFQSSINEQLFIHSPLFAKPYYNAETKRIYYVFKNNGIAKFKKNFGYCFISFTNNIINYINNYNQIRNDFFIEINVLPYDEMKLQNSNEIVNKYSKPNDNIINKDNKGDNQNKSSSVPVALIIILIIIFVLVILYLIHRFYRKRNLSKMNDYFINDFPNTN